MKKHGTYKNGTKKTGTTCFQNDLIILNILFTITFVKKFVHYS